jgi:hypothetical protein
VSLPLRIVTLVVAFAAVVAVATFVVIHYVLAKPPVEDFTSQASGGQVNVTMQTTPETTVSTRPDWVSYFIKNPQTGNWDHTTLFKVPANTRVNVTILGYDGCTPPRNPLWSKVMGTIGGVEYVNGKPTTTLNGWSDCTVQHTFAIPGLGLSVPVASPTTVKENNNLCPTAPCTLSSPHTVVQFSFRTPAKGGTFIWQCRVPCGGGFLYGNGGPMSTYGYMTGQLEVAS